MFLKRLSAFLFVLCLTGIAPAALAASADAFPSKPLVYMVPFNPGGESDIIAKAQLPYLEKLLGKSALITYKMGGGGATGWGELVRSDPDGHTFASINLPHIILQPLQRKSVAYRTEDLQPVMIFSYTSNILLVKKNSPYTTLEEFLAAARKNPGMIMLGGSGTNSSNHIAVTLLNKLAGVKISYVPFTGTGDAMPPFLGGHITGLMTHTAMGVLHKNDVRVLAIAAAERFLSLPDTPTFRELGYDLVENTYRGIAVPDETPEQTVKTLYEACRTINETPDFIKEMTDNGFRLVNYGPEDAALLIEEKTAQYKEILGDLAN